MTTYTTYSGTLTGTGNFSGLGGTAVFTEKDVETEKITIAANGDYTETLHQGNEYFVATNHAEAAVSADDAIVKLVGVTDMHHAINVSGSVTLHI